MAIQQKRVIALINAATDAFQAVNRIQTHAAQLVVEINSRIKTPEQAFYELAGTIPQNEVVFKRYFETRHTIQQELQWFTTHAQSNASKAALMRKLREQRRADGILPEPKRRRKHIPKSLFETDKINEPNTFTPDKEPYKPPIIEMTEQEWKEWEEMVPAASVEPTHPLTIKPAFNPDKYKDDPDEKPKLPNDYDPYELPPPGKEMP